MKAKDLLISNNYWLLNKGLVNHVGIDAALILSTFSEAELLFDDKQNDGWFFQTIQSIENMTTLSRRRQEKAIDVLVKNKLLLKENRGMPMKRYFKINEDELSVFFFKCTSKDVQNVQTKFVQNVQPNMCKTYNNKELNNKELNNKENIVSKKESKNTNKTTYDEIINNYTDNTELKNAIIDFVKMRTMIKKKLTDRALNLILNKLDKISTNDEEKIDILNQSIMNSYQGVFPLKTNNANKIKEDIEVASF